MGVRYDEQQNKFVFDFEHDGQNDIIQLTGDGSTLNEVLRALRILNETNKIAIFSLIGRRDLTIESME